MFGYGVENGVNSANLALKVSHTDLLLLLCDLIVHIHRNADVGVSHDFLDDLQVCFMLTQPGTERMPIRYNKDKSEKPVFPRVLTICPYSFSIRNDPFLRISKGSGAGHFTLKRYGRQFLELALQGKTTVHYCWI